VAASGQPDERFAVSHVAIGGDRLALVLGCQAMPSASALPPKLAAVADGVTRGLTDKQIADELGAPLATVRTYVQRVYRRLGVHSRIELARRRAAT
jgi:DNA-binding NarL/FixJ family response regulator